MRKEPERTAEGLNRAVLGKKRPPTCVWIYGGRKSWEAFLLWVIITYNGLEVHKFHIRGVDN